MIAEARIFQINVSDGGVPKLPVHGARVTSLGLEGDRQDDLGSTGENLTLAGLDWAQVVPGVRLHLGDEVVVEVTQYTTPCHKLVSSFADGAVQRMSQEQHPGWARVYTRVLSEGQIRIGDRVHIEAAGG
jgi:MOSC domain-containing protein YiiM